MTKRQQLFFFTVLGMLFCLLASPFCLAFLIMSVLMEIVITPYKYCLAKVYEIHASLNADRKPQVDVTNLADTAKTYDSFEVGDEVLHQYTPDGPIRSGVVASISSSGLVLVNFPGSQAEPCLPECLKLARELE